MSIFAGHRRQPPSEGLGHDGPSDAHVEWLNSGPLPGEVLVDTGLASAVDCQKLRQPSNMTRGALDREIARMTFLVESTKELFASGNVEAEAQRVNDLVAAALKRVGLDPESSVFRFLREGRLRVAGRRRRHDVIVRKDHAACEA